MCTEITPLRRRMIENMRVRYRSPVTQRCYVDAVAKFARHFNRSPDRLGLEEIRAYQIHLTTTGISWAGFNVAVCAPRFFYCVTLVVSRSPAISSFGSIGVRRGGPSALAPLQARYRRQLLVYSAHRYAMTPEAKRVLLDGPGIVHRMK
jgi:hypothetical protein